MKLCDLYLSEARLEWNGRPQRTAPTVAAQLAPPTKLRDQLQL
jgi:hypothetical protein